MGILFFISAHSLKNSFLNLITMQKRLSHCLIIEYLLPTGCPIEKTPRFKLIFKKYIIPL